MTKEEIREYNKAWYQAHKEARKASAKAWYEANKEQHKSTMKAYYQANKEQHKASMKAWREANKEQINAYLKSDVNSLGQTKHSIRMKSRQILKKTGTKIPGYEIHHCCTYDDPAKFIYISKSLHLKIHQYLRDNNIDADSDHYDYIKHLIDESVVKYNID